MKQVLIAVGGALALSGAALAAAPAPIVLSWSGPAPGETAPTPGGNPLDAARLAARVCLSQVGTPAEIEAVGIANGLTPFFTPPTGDPTGAALTAHRISVTEVDELKISFSLRGRLLTVANKRPVEVTECGLVFEKANLSAPVAASLGRMLGPSAGADGDAAWAFRVGRGQPVPIVAPEGDFGRAVDLAQPLGPDQAIVTVSVMSRGPVTMIQTSSFRPSGAAR